MGANVCFPLFHSPDFDLIAEVDGRLIRVQVKTSTLERGSSFQVQLATSGGNQSWNGVVKFFDPARCDYLFVLVADGRRWFIPAAEIDCKRAIVLGNDKYAEFEVGQVPSTIEPDQGGRRSGRAGPDCKSGALVAEWVRIPPPPLATADDQEVGSVSPLASARTRISANHQLTIPLPPFEAAELEVGDQFRVDALGIGQILLTRATELAHQYAAALFGSP